MASTRIPCNLLYLTIFNPSITPKKPPRNEEGEITGEYDEDAEEQAQILFYTSRDRAVSRDKMLRQVGLAKALITFSEYVFLKSEKYHSLMRSYHIGCLIPTNHVTMCILNPGEWS
jgi:hypothetical protein